MLTAGNQEVGGLISVGSGAYANQNLNKALNPWMLQGDCACNKFMAPFCGGIMCKS